MTEREHVVKRVQRYQAVKFDGSLSSARHIGSYFSPTQMFHINYHVDVRIPTVHGEEIPGIAYLEITDIPTGITTTIIHPTWFVLNHEEHTLDILTDDEYRRDYRKATDND
jgi:hypothetical protein